MEEATAVLGLVVMLEGRRAKPAAQALAGLLDSRTLLPAAEVAGSWPVVFRGSRRVLRDNATTGGLMYIGIGTVLLIILIVLLIMFVF
jgi:hypothetical protein